MGSGLLDNLNAIKSSEPDPIDPTPLIPIDPFLSEDHFLSIFRDKIGTENRKVIIISIQRAFFLEADTLVFGTKVGAHINDF